MKKNGKVYIRTFGCQMNVRDSQILKGLLLSEGYNFTDNEHQADVIIFNTCAVRKHAEDRVFSLLGAIGKRKEKTGQPKAVVLMGCMAQEWKEQLFKRAPYIDIACGPNNVYDLPQILEKVLFSNITHIALVDKPSRAEAFYRQGAWFVEGDSAFVIVMEGCDNFCSYCIVPYVRGRERSRPWQDVVGEIKMLLDKGIKKFTLLGQNVNSYQGGINFPDLLDRVAKIKGVEELSFVTSHPKDACQALFEVMAAHQNIKKYLHLPLQSGSNRILKLMNRNYNYETYLEKVNLYRKIVGGKISSDLIVGFPTETDKDFLSTLNAVKEIQYDSAYIFKYSPRQYTAASKMKDDVPQEIKEKRHAELLALQKQISQRKNVNL